MATNSSRSRRRTEIAVDAHGNWRLYTDELHLGAVSEAALRAFTEFGFHGTSIRLIAKQADISVPGLYYHFETKQQILVDLLRRSNNDLMRRAMEARQEGADDPRTRFCLLVENIILYMTRRQLFARLGHEVGSLEEPFRSEHVARRDELENMLRQEIAAAQKLQIFRTTDVREATRAVWVMCRGVADWYVKDGPKTPEEIALTYVNFALAVVSDRKSTT